jgi:hypothetical protein
MRDSEPKLSGALAAAIGFLDKCPTVDTVPAPIKCGECKSCHTNGYSGVLFCDARPNVNAVNLDDFCSYGERKGGEPHA